MAPGLLDSETFGFQTLQHVMRVFRTWDSVVSLLPKGGETIWGDLNRSPEEENVCYSAKNKYLRSFSKENDGNNTDPRRSIQVKELVKYGRLISFGKTASEIPSSQLSFVDPKVTASSSTFCLIFAFRYVIHYFREDNRLYKT